MLLALLLSLSMAASAVTGVVKDSNGGVIPGATITVRTPAGAEQQVAVTGADGRFSLEITAAEATLIVHLDGFADKHVPVSASGQMEIVLEPASIFETVLVSTTRTEQRLGNVPASVNVLTSESIQASPAVIADDVLRQVPSFSLFRRTSGMVAQPTTQGVSLRGIGPSGQSRTLVLLDGVPFNDPFGGWVYWTRVPLMAVDQIEITEDTASSLYGNYAMGGVINILTNRPTSRTIDVKTQYGNLSTPKLDFFGSDRWNKVSAAIEGSFFNTDGFPIVAERERGPIDNNADVEYKNLTGKVEYDPTDRLHTTFRASRFTEARTNAKVGELNDTNWTAGSTTVRALFPDNSTLQGQLFFDDEDAHFNFLAVSNAATTRNFVRLATDQNVPVNNLGGSLQWTKVGGTAHVLSVGTDLRNVHGESQEDAYVAATPATPGPDGVTLPATLSLHRQSGGAQSSIGAFASDIFTPTEKLVLTLSGRIDYWKNYDGHNRETSATTGAPTANYRDPIPDKTDTVFSPRVAALYHVTEQVTGWAAYNSGFRAPTLTELYRQFSVGAVTTRPNDQLNPERLKGGEAGVNIAPAKNLTTRLTWFDNRVENPISNVTVNPTTAQKQNLGATRIWGVQTDVEYRVNSMLRVAAAYIYNQAKVTEADAAPALVGLYLAQVPVHRGSLQVTYANPKIVNLALGVQFVGKQFNDDLNVNFIPVETLVASGYPADAGVGLPGYNSIDFSASRNFGSNLQVFFGVQNLADTIYFVQTNPSTIGTPRLINAGVRVRFAGR